MLSKEEVVWAFRYSFGRDPESEEVIRQHSKFSSWKELRDALQLTDEFQNTVNLCSLKDKWILAPVHNGQRCLWMNLGDRYVSRGCLSDNYEQAQSEFVKKALRAGDTMFDIGANIGWYTMLASILVGDKGSIHAFEPRKETAHYLQLSIEQNKLLSQITLHPYGVSDKVKNAYLSWAAGTDNPGGSFVSDKALDSGMISQEIKLIPLDSLSLPAVDFIKIDVEGSEYDAFMGAKRLIRGSRPIVMSEINPGALMAVSGRLPNELLALFTSDGYIVKIVEHDSNERITEYPEAWPRDLLNVALIPKERM